MDVPAVPVAMALLGSVLMLQKNKAFTVTETKLLLYVHAMSSHY